MVLVVGCQSVRAPQRHFTNRRHRRHQLRPPQTFLAFVRVLTGELEKSENKTDKLEEKLNQNSFCTRNTKLMLFPNDLQASQSVLKILSTGNV